MLVNMQGVGSICRCSWGANQPIPNPSPFRLPWPVHRVVAMDSWLVYWVGDRDCWMDVSKTHACMHEKVYIA